MISANARFAIIALLLTGAALFLHTRARKDVLPPGVPLSTLPLQFGNWMGRDIPFAPETLASLGRGEFVQRVYQDKNTAKPYVDLYLAHAPRWERHALDYHLPIDCIIGSGWSLAESGTTTFSFPKHPRIVANRYMIAKGSDHQLVLFWFWVHGQGVASMNWADYYLTLDYLRSNRNDFMLVRINTPLGPGGADDAQRRLLSFAAHVIPLMDRYTSR